MESSIGETYLSTSNNNFSINKNKNLYPTYLLGPGDIISVRVYKFDDFGSKVTVLPDGTINLPRINSLYVNNLSLNQANDLITKNYKKIIKTPIVYIDLIQARALRINVSGEVQKPGIYTMGRLQNNKISNSDGGESFNITSVGWPSVIEAIQKAGGLTPEADFRNVKLKRFNKKRKMTEEITINFWDTLTSGDTSNNYPIFDGDGIHVMRASNPSQLEQSIISKTNLSPSTITVTVIGEVVKPGKTNIRANSPIRQSILKAGGYTFRANQSKLTLLRLKNNGKIEKQILRKKDFDNLDNIFLKDRDVILVDRNKLANTSQNLKAVVEPLSPVLNAVSVYKILFGD